MNNPFDFFEEIYCINLDYRVDRWELVKKEFEKVGILDRVKRFSAIKENDGRVGIIKSNLEIVKIAKSKGLKNVLVFEDDVKFLDNDTLDILEKSIKQLNNKNLPWKLFYLGANTHNKLTKITDNLIILKDSYAVHSMAYSENIYTKFINYASNINQITDYNQILDVWLSVEVQNKDICLMTNPMITTQRESYSDIEKRNVNYSFIEERFNQNIK